MQWALSTYLRGTADPNWRFGGENIPDIPLDRAAISASQSVSGDMLLGGTTTQVSVNLQAVTFAASGGMVLSGTGVSAASDIVVSTLISPVEVLKRTFDATNGALKATAAISSDLHGTLLDAGRIWKAVRSTAGIQVVVVTATGEPGISMLDAEEILKDVYDPQAHALRVCTGTADRDFSGSRPDEAQIMKIVYVKADHALAIDAIGSASGTYGTKLDEAQVIEAIFNNATGRLRLVS